MNVYGCPDKFISGVAINADAMADKIFYTSFEDGCGRLCRQTDLLLPIIIV